MMSYNREARKKASTPTKMIPSYGFLTNRLLVDRTVSESFVRDFSYRDVDSGRDDGAGGFLPLVINNPLRILA
jgi:hypothetical protein